MFHHPGQKIKTPYVQSLKDLTAIVPPLQLLTETKRQELLQNIYENSSFDAPQFDTLCSSLIHHVIAYCQHLPETSNNYYAQSGGMFDHALNRTEAALSLFRQVVVQDQGIDLSEEQKLWLYALFSASMLQGIGKLQIDYSVELFDATGHLIKHWNPLLESMLSGGNYYDFEFEPEGPADLRCRLNLMLARQLMPPNGFAWIASNPTVLAVWLALLSEDMRSAGTLGALLIRANAISIQRYFNELLLKGGVHRGARQGRIGTFVDSTPESLIDKERLIGAAFLKWLADKLASGQIMVNKAPLLSVPGGLLMSNEAYKWFIREHSEYKNWQAAQAAFLSLGLHSEGGEAVGMEQAGDKKNDTGVVFSDYLVALPDKVSLYDPTSGTSTVISSVDLAYSSPSEILQQSKDAGLPQLLSNGEWQASLQKQREALQVGTTNSG